jgi:hypothetical protein
MAAFRVVLSLAHTWRICVAQRSCVLRGATASRRSGSASAYFRNGLRMSPRRSAELAAAARSLSLIVL